MLKTEQWPHQLVQEPEINMQTGVVETMYVQQTVTVKSSSDNYGKYALQFHEDPTGKYWSLKPDEWIEDPATGKKKPAPYNGIKYPNGTVLNVNLITTPWQSNGKSGINYNIRKIREVKDSDTPSTATVTPVASAVNTTAPSNDYWDERQRNINKSMAFKEIGESLRNGIIKEKLGEDSEQEIWEEYWENCNRAIKGLPVYPDVATTTAPKEDSPMVAKAKEMGAKVVGETEDEIIEEIKW